MYVQSVNIGRAEAIRNAKASGKTGIYKRPVDGPTQITSNGLPGDAICDTENHGGEDQAVYVYGMPDYDRWSHALDKEFLPGTFGENVTIAGLESDQLAIGDRLQIGEVILEITSPRIPCVTLAQRMGDPAFLKKFRAAERPGVYCRVIREGLINAGDEVTYEPYAGERVTALEVFRDFFEPDLTEAAIRRHLAAPIAIRARMDKEEQLRKVMRDTKFG